MWYLASELVSDLDLSVASSTFNDIIHPLILCFESLHPKSEWNPSVEWKKIEQSARMDQRSRADWRKIADFIVAFCEHLLKAIGLSEVVRCACRECQKAIYQFRAGTNQDLSSIVEKATQSLYDALSANAPSRSASRPQTPPDLKPSKKSPVSSSSWVSSHRITHTPDIFKDRKAVRASSKVLNGDRPRFGPVHEVTVTGDSSRFVGKYFHYFEDSERRLSQYRDLMKRFCTFNHPCLSPIAYCCDPIPGNGPIIVSHFCPRGSIQSLLEIPIAESALTSTLKAVLICELVSGLFYLHFEQVIHGQLKPCNLILDDDFHLHISGFATTSLLGAKLVSSQRSGITHYAAPEIFEGSDSRKSTFERRSKIDIYSLGFIIYELFGNPKRTQDLRSAQLAFRARTNERPALPGGINVRLGNLISRCWDSDPDKRPTIEEVLREMASMRFQFVSDVDCELVMNRALAVGPSDLITSSLPDGVPAFEATPVPQADKKPGDSETPNGSDRGGALPVILPFGRVMRMLIDYFDSLNLNPEWNLVDTWRDIFLEEGPAKVQEVREPPWNKIANFIIRYCTELLSAGGICKPFRRACRECRSAIETALRHRDPNLSFMVADATRKLHSSIPPPL
jgi:hypothetical protein